MLLGLTLGDSLRKFHAVQSYTSPVNPGQRWKAHNVLLWLWTSSRQ